MICTKKTFSLLSLLLLCGAVLPADNTDTDFTVLLTQSTVKQDDTHFPHVEIRQTVTTQNVEHGNRASVEVGDVVTLTTTLTNTGNADGPVRCSISLPDGLCYVVDTFLVDGCTVNPAVNETQVSYPLTLSAYNEPGSVITVSLQARVDRFPNETTTLIPFATYSPMGQGFDVYMGTSNLVLLVLKGSSVNQSYLNISETVSTANTTQVTRADIHPNEILTLTMNMNNLGDVAENQVLFTTYLQNGLKYIADSFTINGEQNNPSISTTEWKDTVLTWNFETLPAYETPGTPITLSFQAQAEPALFETNSFVWLDSMLSLANNQGDTGSNKVLLILKR